MLIKPNLVLLDTPVLEAMLASFRAAAPNECMYFLGGDLLPAQNSFSIDVCYMPTHYPRPDGCGWDSDELLVATKWLLSHNYTLMGVAHSHPHLQMWPEASMQSHQDAKVNETFNLKLSLVMAVTPDDFWLSAWMLNYPAPLDLRVGTEEKSIPFKKWRLALQKKERRK